MRFISPAEPSGGSPLAYILRRAGRRYGEGATTVAALDDIDLEIRAGEFVAVVGPSGSGKSTLLQLLGALDRPTSGSIEFEGRDLSRLGDDDLAALRLERIGFVFQQFNLIPTLTARENIEVAIAPTGVAGGERIRRSDELLRRVGLSERAEHLPSQLSGGEQQRVAIARALANSPDVLLADEPTGNLDSSTGESILGLLRELWSETGVTVVLITHDASIAGRAERIVRLADGRIDESHVTAALAAGGVR
jgi:putative ABC transport system ATP-binding protein